MATWTLSWWIRRSAARTPPDTAAKCAAYIHVCAWLLAYSLLALVLARATAAALWLVVGLQADYATGIAALLAALSPALAVLLPLIGQLRMAMSLPMAAHETLGVDALNGAGGPGSFRVNTRSVHYQGTAFTSWCAGRTTIVIPSDEAEGEAWLAHELAHVRHGDHLVAALAPWVEWVALGSAVAAIGAKVVPWFVHLPGEYGAPPPELERSESSWAFVLLIWLLATCAAGLVWVARLVSEAAADESATRVLGRVPSGRTTGLHNRFHAFLADRSRARYRVILLHPFTLAALVVAGGSFVRSIKGAITLPSAAWHIWAPRMERLADGLASAIGALVHLASSEIVAAGMVVLVLSSLGVPRVLNALACVATTLLGFVSTAVLARAQHALPLHFWEVFRAATTVLAIVLFAVTGGLTVLVRPRAGAVRRAALTFVAVGATFVFLQHSEFDYSPWSRLQVAFVQAGAALVTVLLLDYLLERAPRWAVLIPTLAVVVEFIGSPHDDLIDAMASAPVPERPAEMLARLRACPSLGHSWILRHQKALFPVLSGGASDVPSLQEHELAGADVARDEWFVPGPGTAADAERHLLWGLPITSAVLQAAIEPCEKSLSASCGPAITIDSVLSRMGGAFASRGEVVRVTAIVITRFAAS